MEGGRVLQIGTAEEILENPENEYVRSFFGGVNVSNVYQARNIASRESATVIREPLSGIRRVLQRLRDSLLRASHSAALDLSASYLPIEPVPANTSVDDLIDLLGQQPSPLPIVDERGRFLGIVSKTILLEAVHHRRGEE